MRGFGNFLLAFFVFVQLCFGEFRLQQKMTIDRKGGNVVLVPAFFLNSGWEVGGQVEWPWQTSIVIDNGKNARVVDCRKAQLDGFALPH